MDGLSGEREERPMAGLIEGQGVKVAYRSRAELGSGFTDWVRGRLSAEPWIAD